MGPVDSGLLVLIGLVMAIGLVGVVVPGVPGLLLVAGAGLAWAAHAGGAAPWVVLGVMLAVLAVGTIGKYVLPGRRLAGSGAPRSTLLLGAVGAIAGFFVIPVVGLPVGGLAGVWLGELRRLRSAAAARRSTWATAKAMGLGMLVELAAGMSAVLIWLVGALVLRA